MLLALAAGFVGCAFPGMARHGHNLPPSERILHPGPGVGGPGPGVLPPAMPLGAPAPMQQPIQVYFSRPEGMQVHWSISPGGGFNSAPLITPGRANFPQGAIYQIKLTDIEGRLGVELYPTLEVANTTPRTAAYLAHNAVPIQFTPEDFDQVLSGNFVTKVIYLPDPEFQELALSGVETLVSTRLAPGVDPISEADHRGSIMAIIRMGNIDKEMPSMVGGLSGNYPDGGVQQASGMLPPGLPPGMPPGMIPPGMMGPPGVIPPYGVPPYGAQGYMAPYPNAPVPMAPPSGAGGMGGGMNNYVSGVTGPQWGMPMSGTPIGLPGPPHIPHGSPAGLQRHVMHNHTHMQIPGPTPTLQMHVQQSPGLSYPAPANTMHLREKTVSPPFAYGQPASDMRHVRAGPGAIYPPGYDASHDYQGGGHAEGCMCPSCRPAP
ncbi:hypothetical protein [Lignipirellula cremea]|nr:hypothetical protein [Lignipirellula cremea]